MSPRTTEASAAPAWLSAPWEWIEARRRALLVLAVAFQIVVLLVMIAGRVIPLATGETILVRVVPVDPRDFFRGDYVVLTYEFSRVSTVFPSDPRAPDSRSSPQHREGTTIYVPLEPEADGRHWVRAAPPTLTRPAAGKYIRGTVTGHGRATFGIESFFVQEGQGLAYEQAVRESRLSAEISLTEDGTAVLENLVIE